MSNKLNDTNIDPNQLITTYKKNGVFDKQRKLLLDDFKQSQTSENLMLKLKIMIEGKIKNDPMILMKNKGKMAALIQGEILNNTDESSSILNIVDKDIQDKIIDSTNFHNILREELLDTKRKILGISDEEFEKIKLEDKQRMEKLEMESRLKNVKLMQQKQQLKQQNQKHNNSYKDNFKIKNLQPSNGFSNGSNQNSHRVNKAPKFNIKDSKDEAKKDEKKKIPFMMY